MPTFQDSQSNLQRARKDREAVAKTVFLTKERVKKLARQKTQVLRSSGKDSDTYRAMRRNEETVKQSLASEESRLSALLEAEGRFIREFEPFTDPRLQMDKFSDNFPVLLFPVRLETRFKRIPQVGGGLQHQLWVRIFPDECSIDTFDETLSETELAKVQNYWLNIWKTGKAGHEDIEPFVQDKERGAWRELMGTFNAGRAYFIKENFAPMNAAEIPVRNDASDKILVIPTEELPDANTQEALRDYWTAVLLADGVAEKVKAAFDAFVSALGVSEEDALLRIEENTPDNIESGLDEGAPLPDVQVVFVVFPRSENLDTKLAAWSQAATVTTFPERFVLLGYQEGADDPVIEELGKTVIDPLVVGPDPSMDAEAILRSELGSAFDDLSDDEKAEKYVEYLSERSDTKWLFDFDEAVRVGMGFKVDVSEDVFTGGLKRLFVLGVKLSASEEIGKTSLEELIRHHHFGDSGFAILPQGTATNNTDNSRSGYAESEDADQAYDNYYNTTASPEPSEEGKKLDGRWLAELLGISVDGSTLNLAPGYRMTDQCEARAMNTALWNATLGYFMESMLTPAFNERQRNLTRWFLINHVSGRGRVPAIRIGDQPYGILPVTTVSDMAWLDQDNAAYSPKFLEQLRGLREVNSVLQAIRQNLETHLDSVAFVGGGGDRNAHDLLLQVLGLHANSVEFDQRYAESFAHHYNWLIALGAAGETMAGFLEAGYKRRGMQLLSDHGYSHNDKLDPNIPILDKFFLTTELDVNKPLIDDRELSEVENIRAYTDIGQNYIEWLLEKAKNDHRVIKDQSGFSDNKAPFALLYDMLRHSLNLEFGNAGLNLYRAAGIIGEVQANAYRVDPEFIGIQSPPKQFESKWDLIYRTDNRVTDGGVLLVDHISDLVKTQVVNSQTRHLHEVLNALEQLKDVPTARLERAFVEHLDLCTYRLDAWLLGLVNVQLHAMRYPVDTEESVAREGIYLGAYGWLENLKADDAVMEPAELAPDDQVIFDPDGTKQLMTDSTNAGHIHAPSINHGLTAAVLRNAYISSASEEEAEPFKVNLSSERVRLALSIIEGMQQGQSLGALLGYQLERGLHDRSNEEMDIYIYELRKVFPLVSNRMVFTQIKEGKEADTPDEVMRNQEEVDEFAEGKAITKIEARNVVNGLSLLDHIRKTKKDNYPFGFEIGEGPDKLLSAGANERKAINAEVQRLMNIRDAVADLAMAESVHQVVQGNYDRAAGALDSYSKGHYPQLPDVIQSPGSGISLTSRFGIHLPAGIVPAAGDTPRARAEPAINKWIEDLIPSDLSKVACLVEFRVPNYDDAVPDPLVQKTVSVANLELSPIDLLYMINIESEKSLTALDDQILNFVHTSESPRPDIDIEIKYTHAFDAADNTLSFFELAAMMGSLRALVISSRPLTAADMALQNEGSKKKNMTASIDRSRITDTRQDILDIVANVQSDVIDPLATLIDDEDFEVTVGNAAAILPQADARISHFIAHLRLLSGFGIPQSGFGFIYNRKSAIYAAINRKIADYRNRWRKKQARYEGHINVELPAATTDEERRSIMAEAERAISTEPTTSQTTIPEYQVILDGKKLHFDNKLAELDAFLAGNFATLQALLTEVSNLTVNFGDFDLVAFEINSEIRQILILVEDLYSQARSLVVSMEKMTVDVQVILNEESAAASSIEKVKLLTDAAHAIFGEDFQIIPEFTLTEDHGKELQKCLDDQSQLLSYQVVEQSTDFPVDDWLYGVARVREKLGAWENLVILAEGFKERSPVNLTPLQLPYVENDNWLGLDYPGDFEISSDKLLYTAYVPNFDASKPQCGLFVDEWTEIIPAKTETTGLTFHYDQPNSEPPQTMLLVTPSAFTGDWQWRDLVNTMHETLDLAKLRAIEPDHIDRTAYAQFLPATVAAVTTRPVTMALNYAMPADQIFQFESNNDA